MAHPNKVIHCRIYISTGVYRWIGWLEGNFWKWTDLDGAIIIKQQTDLK